MRGQTPKLITLIVPVLMVLAMAVHGADGMPTSGELRLDQSWEANSMCRKRIESGFILAALLISLISISSAAAPRAMPDLYQGKCGVELSVPAPGLLANDMPSGKPLKVST